MVITLKELSPIPSSSSLATRRGSSNAPAGNSGEVCYPTRGRFGQLHGSEHMLLEEPQVFEMKPTVDHKTWPNFHA